MRFKLLNKQGDPHSQTTSNTLVCRVELFSVKHGFCLSQTEISIHLRRCKGFDSEFETTIYVKKCKKKYMLMKIYECIQLTFDIKK